MKNKMKNLAVAALGAGAIFLLGVLPASAQIGVNAGANATVSTTAPNVIINSDPIPVAVNSAAGTNSAASIGVYTKIGTALIARANTEITARINALNSLNSRVEAMQKLSSDEKNNLASSIQAQIADMINVQAQIKADINNAASLRADFQSITKAYRIYMLVLPQGLIQAASDRILTITGAMTTLSGDLEIRINPLQDAAAGGQPFPFDSSLLDMNAKISDATAQAQAAVTETASLTPDNGSSTIMQSNTATLKDARSKIQAAQKDLIAARTDATTIIKAVKAAEKMDTNASTSVSASTTGQ
jgi:hypothetical protein